MAKKKKQPKAAAVKPKSAEKLKNSSVAASATSSGLKKPGNRHSVSSVDGVAPRKKLKARQAEEMVIPSRSGDTIVVFSIDPGEDSSSPNSSPVSKKLTSRSRNRSYSVAESTNVEDPVDSDRAKIVSPNSADDKMDSDSSDECYDSYAASCEPINIHDVIGGDGDFTPLYLRYDSVINNALKGDDSGAGSSDVAVESSGVKAVDKVVEEGVAAELVRGTESTTPAGSRNIASEIVFEPEPYVVTKRKGDSFYSAKNQNLSSDTYPSDDDDAIRIESSPSPPKVAEPTDRKIKFDVSSNKELKKESSSSKATVFLGKKTGKADSKVPSLDTENEDPTSICLDVSGREIEWSTERMSDCFVKVEKIQVKRIQGENDGVRTTAANLCLAEDQADLTGKELSVTQQLGTTSSTKPGPRGRRRTAVAQKLGKKTAVSSKSEEDSEKIELFLDEIAKKSMPSISAGSELQKTTAKRKTSVDTVQARPSTKVSVPGVLISKDIDKGAIQDELLSCDGSITPKTVDSTSSRSSDADEQEALSVGSADVAKSDSLTEADPPSAGDSSAEKCVALSRPRRLTRAPKRIADAVKPKVNSRNSGASKHSVTTKGTTSAVADPKTAGQVKAVGPRAVEDKKKLKKSLAPKEPTSDQGWTSPPESLAASTDGSLMAPRGDQPASSVAVQSKAVETAEPQKPFNLPQWPPPTKAPGKITAAEPALTKPDPVSAVQRLRIPPSAEVRATVISSNPASAPVTMEGHSETSKISTDLVVPKVKPNDIPPESLDKNTSPSDFVAEPSEATSKPIVCSIEPPKPTEVLGPIENTVPPLGDLVSVDANAPKVQNASLDSKTDSASSNLKIAAPAITAVQSSLEVGGHALFSGKEEIDVKTTAPELPTSKAIDEPSSNPPSDICKDKTLVSIEPASADAPKKSLEPTDPKSNKTTLTKSPSRVPQSAVDQGKRLDASQTSSAPENLLAKAKVEPTPKEKCVGSSNPQAPTIKDQGPQPAAPILSASKEKQSATSQTGSLKEKKIVPLASPTPLTKEKSLGSPTPQIAPIKENKSGPEVSQVASAKETNVPQKQGVASIAVVESAGKSAPAKALPQKPDTIALAKIQSPAAKSALLPKDPRSVNRPAVGKNPQTPDSVTQGSILIKPSQNSPNPKEITLQPPEAASTPPSTPKQDIQKPSTTLPKLTEVDIFNLLTPPVKPVPHTKKGSAAAKTSSGNKAVEPLSKSATAPAKSADVTANPDTLASKTLPNAPKSSPALLKLPASPKPASTSLKSSGAQPESGLSSSFAAEATPAVPPVGVDVPVKVQTASLSIEVSPSPKAEAPVVQKPAESPKPSPSKAQNSSPKVVSASKASSPKVSPSPKSSGPRVATKAALKSFGSPKPQQATKSSSKAPPQKAKSAKTTTPKGAKGIAKATAKLAMAQEISSKEIGTAEIKTEPTSDVKPLAALGEAPSVKASNSKTGPAKEETTKAAKTPKVETKKEKEAAKKVEGSTRRRSNRIRVNRWDEGPNIAAAAAAAASAAATSANSGQVDTSSASHAVGPTTAAVSQVSLKNANASANLPPPPPPPPAAGFEADKPVKVKSRWRRTSELEMGSRTGPALEASVAIPTSPAPAGMSPSSPSPVPPPPPPSEPPPASSANSPTRPSSADLPLSAAADQVPFKAPLPVYDFDHPEIAERMKQFDVIRESIYLTERHQSKETKRMVCECTLSDDEVARGEMGCGEDCLNRLLFIECSRRCTLGSLCSNKRFQNYENAKCAVVRTQDKGLGLIASSQIPGGEFLMEYVGEVIDPKEFRRRAKDYSKEKNRHFYFMSLKSDSIIDATVKGSISRFINHSCDPNAETQKWTVNGELRIGFFSKRQINENEEITFDYQFQRYGKEAIRCFCGSTNCRGWIGEDPDNDEKEEEKDQKWGKREKREKKKSREEVLEELEEEIEKLRLSGIKNRAHTLMLNRLMVRAEDHSSRSQLLAITQAGVDQRCLRLFLDYHGLNLLWSWMVDHSAPTSVKIQILDTLSVLPITNKTILQDSKVLAVVERWANSGASSAEPKARPEDEKEGSSPDSEETTNDGSATPSTEKKKCDVVSDPDDPEWQTVVAKATALFQGWSVLKEEFRIPKKQKIEQMKEHERDADRGYVDHEKAVKTENSYDRHWSFDKDRSKRRGRESPDSVEWKAKSSRTDEKNSGPRLSKSQRRQLFAMKVEEEERQKRMEEERWVNHQEQCYALGVDPNMVDPNMTYPPQANGGYYHPLDGADVPPDVYGPGDPRGPPMYPPPPPSPFMGGHPPPPDPSFPPMSPFQQMNMVPSGPSPPGMGPGMGAPPPGMPPMGPPPPGMGPHPSGMVPHPSGMGPPPPGMVPPGIPGMPMMGMGPYGGPPSLPPFPPNGMPPMAYSNPPMPPQPNYGASPFAPPGMVQALEPPPNGAIPLNSGSSMSKPAYIIKLPENWGIALDKDRNAIYYYHRKTKHVQWHFPTVKDDKTEEAKLERTGIKTAHADDSDDSEEEEEESESEEDESSSDEFEKEEEEDDDEYDDNQLLADAKRKAEEEMMIHSVVTEPNILTGEETGSTDVKMADVSIGSIVADTSLPPLASETGEPPPKKKREGLVTVNIISPRDEADDYRKGIKKSKIRETKMKLARQKAKAKAKARAAAAGHSGKVKLKRSKMCEADTSTGQSRKIKKFRSEMANVIVALLNPYMRPDCKMGRITTNEDFKHLARKLTHFVMVKELKHLPAVENLQCNDNVRHKAKDFIRKYMSKFGDVYSRLPDD